MLDIRVDPASLSDEQTLPLLLLDRLLSGRDVPHDAYKAAKRSFALLPAPELPADYMERGSFVEELLDRDDGLDARMDQLEDRYYALKDDVGTPVDCALRYVRDHPDEFFLSEREATADLDDFTGRLAARVGAVERATAEDVAAAEAELGRPVPPLVRRLYLDVGAGGWGPEGGFLPLRGAGRDSVAGGWAWARREIRGPGIADVWPVTMLPVVRATAEGYICVGAHEAHLRVERLPAEGPRGWYQGRPTLLYVASTLRGWLEEWLADTQPSAP